MHIDIYGNYHYFYNKLSITTNNLMKKYFISCILILTTAQTAKSQLVVSQLENQTVADFKRALLYKDHNTEDNKDLNIVTFESRIQKQNDTTLLFSSECIAVYNISYNNDKIRIRRNVIESMSHKHNSSHKSITTPDLTKKPINIILAEGTRSINTQHIPVTMTRKKETTELAIDKMIGRDTLSTKILGIIMTLESAKEQLTYSSQEDAMYIDNLLKINAKMRTKTICNKKNKEYASTDNIYENINIIQTDKTDRGFKEYIKGLKISLKSISKGKENMSDDVKKEICNSYWLQNCTTN